MIIMMKKNVFTILVCFLTCAILSLHPDGLNAQVSDTTQNTSKYKSF